MQPIVDLASGTIRGVEALTRFRGYTGSPADVFSAATDAGMGVELELAAVRAALLLLSPLPEHLYLSVNVSPATAKSFELEALLVGISAERIILELTEHARFTDHSHLVARLQALKAHGVRIAIDDAGSGYSGLQIILALAPDVIKLDIALVKNVDRDPVRRSLVRAMTGFAAESGATIIAEGIETQTELDTLRELGVNLGQGYHLFRPKPIDDLTWPADPIGSLWSAPRSFWWFRREEYDVAAQRLPATAFVDRWPTPETY